MDALFDKYIEHKNKLLGMFGDGLHSYEIFSKDESIKKLKKQIDHISNETYKKRLESILESLIGEISSYIYFVY